MITIKIRIIVNIKVRVKLCGLGLGFELICAACLSRLVTINMRGWGVRTGKLQGENAGVNPRANYCR